MKKIIVLAAALAFAATGTTFAQTAPAAAKSSTPGKMKSPEAKADHQAAKLGKELGLAPDQEARVEQILLAQRQEMMAMHDKAQAAGTRKGMGPEMKAARDKYDAQLKEALSADQYTKYLAMREERRDKMHEHHATK